MEKTFYLQVQPDGTITDAIEYPYGNYVPVKVENLPMTILGGWHKLENGAIVEHLELKPADPQTELEELKARQAATEEAILGLMDMLAI